MNTTNSEKFSFELYNSLFITGESGSGKTVLLDKIIERYIDANSSQNLRFVILDMTGHDFFDLRKNYYNYIDAYLDGTFSEASFHVLEHMADLAELRVSKGGYYPTYFIIMEECDIACLDQARFENAVIRINRNADKAKIKLIFSTSSPRPDVVSDNLLKSFDLTLMGRFDYIWRDEPSTTNIGKYNFMMINNKSK